MKKYIILAAFAAALAFSSCNKVEPKEEPKNDEQVALRTVNYCARPTETKTVFGSKNGTKYPVLWQEGDKVCPSLNFAAPSSDNYTTVTPENGGTSASFSGPVADAESYQFIFVSPAATFKSINKTNQTVMVEFPSGQTSTAASPDPAAQILFADTGELNPLPSQVDLEFGHLSAYLHLKFANVDLGTATVQAVNITSEDNTIAGRIFYHLDTETFEPSTNFHTIAVATTTLEDVWCGLCPGDFSGKQLTIEVSTDQGTFTKTLTMPASANLPSGKIAKFTVDMTGVSLVAPVVYKAITSANQLNVGDKVIIAAAGEDQAFAMSTGQNTNNRSAAGVTKTVEEITNPTDAVEIFEIEDGVIPGHYAFHATGNPGYIYAANTASSGSNILQTKATMDNSASWAVSVEDVTVTSSGKTWEKATRMFADIPSNGRGMLRFNSSDKLFAAYGAGTSMEAIKVYRLDEPATPHFNATLPNGNEITVAAQDVTVYVWGNVAWTASVTGTGATLDAASGTGNAVLTLSVPENSSTASTQSYSVTISTSAAVATQSYTLNITQAKKVDTGGDPVNVYSFTLTAGNNLGTNGTYAGNCDIAINGITWNVTGVSNASGYDGWRIGGKNLTGTNRAFYSKTAFSAEVTKVIVTHATTTNPITINSFTMSVHSTAADASTGDNPIASLTGTVSTSDPTVFEKPDNTSWAGCFYRLNYNVTTTKKDTNQAVQPKGLEMWGYPAD